MKRILNKESRATIELMIANNLITKDVAEKYFPELKESEDEKIRKWLIALIKSNEYGSISNVGEMPCPKLKVLAWLEKQGEKPNNVYDKELSEILGRVIRRYINDPNILCTEREKVSMKIIPYVERLEKQGNLMKALQISNARIGELIEENYYLREQLEKQGENNMGISEATKQELEDNLNKALEKETPESFNKFLDEQKPADKVEPKFKVGDWVIGQVTHNEPRQISEITDQCYKSTYGGQYGFSFEDEMHLWTINDAKDGDVLASEDKDRVFIYNGKLDLRGRVCAYCGIYKTYDGLRFTKCAIGNYFTYKEPHPATKEQRDILQKAMTNAGYTFDFEKKELKKIEDKPAWSKEDEKMYTATILALAGFMCNEDKIDWLKSLKYRYTWNPSKEQIMALRWILNNVPYNKYKEEISGLLDQIKDL